MNDGAETNNSETLTNEATTETETETSSDTTETEATTEAEASGSLIEGESEKEAEATAPEPLTTDDISFGEDAEVDPELQTELLEVFNNQELDSKSRAQALADLHMKAMKKAGEASAKAWSDMQTTWQDEVKADADVGGEKLQPALDRIGRLVKERGSPELLDALALTGAGNNVHVIKFLDSVAKDLTEGGPVSGGPKSDERSAAAKMFPSMKG